MDWTDDTLLTLDQAAKLIPGADADTLKRLARKGKLRCYRPGKQFLTTPADVWEAVTIKCRVHSPAVRNRQQATVAESGLSKRALGQALENLQVTPRRNKQWSG